MQMGLYVRIKRSHRYKYITARWPKPFHVRCRIARINWFAILMACPIYWFRSRIQSVYWLCVSARWGRRRVRHDYERLSRFTDIRIAMPWGVCILCSFYSFLQNSIRPYVLPTKTAIVVISRFCRWPTHIPLHHPIYFRERAHWRGSYFRLKPYFARSHQGEIEIDGRAHSAKQLSQSIDN